jgi:hypothetical protein
MRFSADSVAESRGEMPVILKSMIGFLVFDDNFRL